MRGATGQATGGSTPLLDIKRPASSRSPRRDSTAHPGGRFWVLAEDDEEDDDGDEASTRGLPEVASPTPSEFAGVGGETACILKTTAPKKDRGRLMMTAADNREMARRRKTAASSIRPWHGPIPKVRLQSLTIADWVHPSTWITVCNKKKKQPPVTTAPAPTIATAEIRSRRLNFLLGLVGLHESETAVGRADDGYVAHHEAQAESFVALTPTDVVPVIESALD
ncbi:hypothetical protein ZWY2020_020019 [Hordeum vulgare]|nr:hypothetical protein ZWY2020_020019 [Hordeum vulgare]